MIVLANSCLKNGITALSLEELNMLLRDAVNTHRLPSSKYQSPLRTSLYIHFSAASLHKLMRKNRRKSGDANFCRSVLLYENARNIRNKAANTSLTVFHHLFHLTFSY